MIVQDTADCHKFRAVQVGPLKREDMKKYSGRTVPYKDFKEAAGEEEFS